MLRKLTVLLPLFAAACTGATPARNVKVYLTDAPLDGATAVNVTIESVTLITGDGQVEVLGEPRTVNLLELRNGARTLLGETEATAIQQIRLQIDGTAEVVYADGTSAEAKVPSGAQTGIKIVGHIDPSAEGEITLDFDAAQSIHEAGDMLIMRPVIKVVMASREGEPDGEANGHADASVCAETGDDVGVNVEACADADAALSKATPAVPPADPPPTNPPEDAAQPAQPADPSDDDGDECRAEASAEAQAGLGEAADASAGASLTVECAVR